jgi:hypothetical protein
MTGKLLLTGFCVQQRERYNSRKFRYVPTDHATELICTHDASNDAD